ncbi:hypothetical protein V3H18_08955 [Methylocystis sp. 9N]|uniref:Site-specific integrase n=1 Tax=Methylocystis borbori TaxID=3118750 RepID=A0ABU7XH00_9HYPH
MATFTKLKSGSWRAQVRRKGKYVNESFLRRRDAEEWALDIERQIDRGESPTECARKNAKTFGDLVRLHREDHQDVGKQIGRSKAASLICRVMSGFLAKPFQKGACGSSFGRL